MNKKPINKKEVLDYLYSLAIEDFTKILKYIYICFNLLANVSRFFYLCYRYFSFMPIKTYTKTAFYLFYTPIKCF